jgi:pimeloyl-ACP methyl ester carboxylesterase
MLVPGTGTLQITRRTCARTGLRPLRPFGSSQRRKPRRRYGTCLAAGCLVSQIAGGVCRQVRLAVLQSALGGSLRSCPLVCVAVVIGVSACSSEPDERPARVTPNEFSEDFVIPGPETGTVLAGTVTWPAEECPCPAVILIPGTGGHDRDYTLWGLKRFPVLAGHLALNGIASLRFDERGVGESTGDPTAATSQDLATDVLTLAAFLRTRPEVARGEIGLVGHSEGGTVASLAAARDSDFAFVVMLASPGLPGRAYNLQFEASMARTQGLDDQAVAERSAFQERVLDAILAAPDSSRAAAVLRDIYRAEAPDIPEEDLAAGLRRLLSPWFRFNLAHDPARTLAGVDAPVLAVYAEKDVQVPPARNYGAMRAILDESDGTNRVVVLPGVNHFFQTADTGSPEEYSKIDEPFAVAAMDSIVAWVRSHTGPRKEER